jgi:FixJ family two-component response regulator
MWDKADRVIDVRPGEFEVARFMSALGGKADMGREVLDYVVRGLLNKLIGADLGVHEKTIKVHRSRVFNKMGARSLAELVRMTNGISE